MEDMINAVPIVKFATYTAIWQELCSQERYILTSTGTFLVEYSMNSDVSNLTLYAIKSK